MPNRLTPLYSEIYYKEENYLKVKTEFFKDKNKKEGVGIIDLINRIVQVLKKDLYWVRISIQNTELIKPVKL